MKDKDDNGSNRTAATSLSSPLKVMISMKYPRRDRLGSNIQRLLFLMAYAHCHGYDFCVKPGSEGVGKYFPGSFSSCTKDIQQTHPPVGVLFTRPINQSGTYWFERDDRTLGRWTRENEDCAFDPFMRSKWREIIIHASYSNSTVNTTLSGEQFFRNTDDPKMTIVAVHIRRGDLQYWGRNVVFDEFYVVLIQKIRSMLQKAGRTPQVHVFSENYGMIDIKRNIAPNWGLYEGIVDHFHLAPDMRTKNNPHAMDLALNLRDWRHFLTADILVVGGTFSAIPALGRPKSPDPKTGLPLTIYPCSGKLCFNSNDSKAKYVYGWSRHGGPLMPDQLNLTNLPEVFAKLDNHTGTSQLFREVFAKLNATGNYEPNVLKLI